jgi:hypothetical protein
VTWTAGRCLTWSSTQIRYMVGAAVAVATGVFPLDFLRACMAIPSRVRLPRAPPHTLVLTNAKFDHARLPSGAVVPENLPPVLALAEAGEAARQCVQYPHSHLPCLPPPSTPYRCVHARSVSSSSLAAFRSSLSLSTSRRYPAPISPSRSRCISLVRPPNRESTFAACEAEPHARRHHLHRGILCASSPSLSHTRTHTHAHPRTLPSLSIVGVSGLIEAA